LTGPTSRALHRLAMISIANAYTRLCFGTSETIIREGRSPRLITASLHTPPQLRYFREVEKDPLKYIFPAPESRQWLASLRQRGLRTFLATNSFAECAVLYFSVQNLPSCLSF
jgi:hypothetical protein